MAKRVLEVAIVGDARDLERALGRAGKATDKFALKQSRAANRIGTAMKAASLAAAGFAAVGVGYAVKSAMSFEKQLSSLGAVADATGKQMEALRKQALKAGADTVYSASEAAKAQTELAKGGLSAAKILSGGLNSALALAAAGELDLADAASYTANAMNLFGLKGKDSIKVADALATAANATTADVADFGVALAQGGSVAKSAGYSFIETTTALEALAAAGIKGSDAGTSVKAALIALLKPSIKQAAAAKEAGLSFLTQSGNMKSLASISKMLHAQLGDQTKAQRTATLATIAGTDGVRTLTALYDAGPAKLKKYEEGLRKQGTAAEVAKKKQDNLAGATEQLKGSVETLGIQLGSKLIPILASAAKAVTGFVTGMSTGEGAGGRFAATVIKIATTTANAAVQVAKFVSSTTGLTAIAAIVGGLTARFVALTTALAVSKVIAFANGIKQAGGAMAALNGIMRANALGIAATAIGAIAGALGIMKLKSDQAKVSTRELTDALRQQADALRAVRDIDIDVAQRRANLDSATVGVEQAEKRLADLRKNGKASALDIKSAEADLEQARVSQKRAQRDLSDAEQDNTRKRQDANQAIDEATAKTQQMIAQKRGELKSIADQIAGNQKLVRVKKAWGESADAEVKKIGELRGAQARLNAEIEKLGSSLTRDTGRHLIGGLIQGIWDKQKDLETTMTTAVMNTAAAAKRAAQVQSPSKVFMKIGEFIGEGFALGIKSKKSSVEKATDEGLLFPLDAAIARLEAKQERIQRVWDRMDAVAQRAELVRAVKDAKSGKGVSDTSSSFSPGGGGGNGGPSYPLGSKGKIIGTPHAGTHTLGNWQSDNAVDISTPVGTPVLAAKGGKVVKVSGGYSGGSSRFDGYQVTVQLDDGNSVFYTHLEKALVKAGEKVAGGQRIGLSGAANGVPHLHFGAEKGDPRDYLNATVGSGSSRRSRSRPGGGGLDRTFPLTRVGKGGAKLSEKQLRAVFESAGFSPAEAMWMAKVSGRESGGHPGIVQYDPGDGNVGYGLTQITPGRGGANWGANSAAYRKFNQLGGATAMRNPVVNAQMARFLFEHGGAQHWASSSNNIPMVTGNVQSVGNVSSIVGSGAGDRNRQIAENVKEATKALAEFDKQARRTAKLARIDVQIRGLEKMKAWKDTLNDISSNLDDLVSQATDAFRDQWEKGVGASIEATNAKILDGIDQANAKALDAFDTQTASMVANGPAAQALAALQAQEDQIQKAAEDASNQQALDDARRSGDPRQIKAAQDAIAETARQRAITAAQAAADAERDQIEVQRAAQRVQMERDQADQRAQIEADLAQKLTDLETQATADFQTQLDTRLKAELASLNARGAQYAEFVRNVNSTLKQVGGDDVVQFVPVAEQEAAVSAGPAMGVAFKPGSAGWNAQWLQAFKDTHRGISLTDWNAGKRASGGLLNYGTVYRVNELGQEGIVRMPAGGTGVVPASRMAMRGGSAGPAVVMTGPVTIGSQRAAERFANTLDYRAKYQP